MQQLSSTAQKLKPERRHLNADLLAGLTFAIVNVPQAMAHALLATVNPVLGIYTLMMAVPIGALFTSSVFMNVSTTSALSVAAGAGLAEIPDGQKAQALVAMVLLVGLIQALAGLFKLGFLVRFVSDSVMTGFLNGVAVLIILGQLGDLTGYDSLYANKVAQALDLLLHLDQVNGQATAIGLLTLGLMVVLLRTSLKKFAFIIAIAVSTLLLAALTLPALGTAAAFASVQTVGDIADIPRALPGLVLPTPALLLTMLLPAFSVAVIGLIQGAGVSQGYPNPDGKYPDISRDFLGQGVANMATSLVGGVPAGGSISGTALIVSAGARSRWTNIFAGLFVALIVLVAAPLVERVPMPALAALLIVAGFQGLRVQQAITVWNTGQVAGVVMVMTFAATLLVPLQYAVLLGVALSILLFVFRQSNKVVITAIVPVPGGLPEERPAPQQLPSNQLTMLMVYGSLFFAAAKNFEELLPAVDRTTHAVVAIGLRGKAEIGSTFVSVLRRYTESLQAHDSQLMLVGVEPAVRKQLAKTGLLDLIGEENVFLATPRLGEAMNQAAAAAYAWLGQQPGKTADAAPGDAVR
ncbi:MAG TPA: SulP family inorganic anion transporter [Anaerolineae bacterium]|nr:SulP family inorganic anion transporter [Anaerolineae bacterium]